MQSTHFRDNSLIVHRPTLSMLYISFDVMLMTERLHPAIWKVRIESVLRLSCVVVVSNQTISIFFNQVIINSHTLIVHSLYTYCERRMKLDEFVFVLFLLTLLWIMASWTFDLCVHIPDCPDVWRVGKLEAFFGLLCCLFMWQKFSSHPIKMAKKWKKGYNLYNCNFQNFPSSYRSCRSHTQIVTTDIGGRNLLVLGLGLGLFEF